MFKTHRHTALGFYLCWITLLIMRTSRCRWNCDRVANVRLYVQSRQVIWVVHRSRRSMIDHVHLPLTGFHFLGLS